MLWVIYLGWASFDLIPWVLVVIGYSPKVVSVTVCPLGMGCPTGIDCESGICCTIGIGCPTGICCTIGIVCTIGICCTIGIGCPGLTEVVVVVVVYVTDVCTFPIGTVLLIIGALAGTCTIKGRTGVLDWFTVFFVSTLLVVDEDEYPPVIALYSVLVWFTDVFISPTFAVVGITPSWEGLFSNFTLAYSPVAP